MIAGLKPDWLLLRPWELGALAAEFPDVAGEYQVQKVFEDPLLPDSQLDTWGGAQIGFAGYDVYNVDMKFIVLKRTAAQ